MSEVESCEIDWNELNKTVEKSLKFQRSSNVLAYSLLNDVERPTLEWQINSM